MRFVKAVAVVSVACFAHAATAGVNFFVNNSVGFNAAVVSFSLVGTETFEESTLAPNMILTFNDPLSPGVANGSFPAGTGTAAGVKVQSNTLGSNPTALSPRGTNGLTTASVGFVGTPTDQISVQDVGDSFDMIFMPSNGQPVRAVRMLPLYFDNAASSSTSNPGTVVIKVYSPTQVLLGTQTMNSVDYSGSSVLGVVATGTDVIGRINVNDTNNLSFFAGADDIGVYTSLTPVELMSFSAE